MHTNQPKAHTRELHALPTLHPQSSGSGLAIQALVMAVGMNETARNFTKVDTISTLHPKCSEGQTSQVLPKAPIGGKFDPTTPIEGKTPNILNNSNWSSSRNLGHQILKGSDSS